MKKILSVLLVSALFFPLIACSNGNTATTPDQNDSSSVVSEISDSILETNDAQAEDDTESSDDSSKDSDSSVSGDIDLQDYTDREDEIKEGSNILVAYFSRVGNTDWESDVDVVTSASLNIENGDFIGNAEYLARMAEEVTGGDLFLIQTEALYPSAYRDTTDVAMEEQKANARPALVSHVENMNQYDTIVLIYPNWWGTLPMPLYTFLEEYDFSGKTILPLCTHEGSRMGSSESTISGLCPEANLLEGLAVRGSDASTAEQEVESWILDAGILQ